MFLSRHRRLGVTTGSALLALVSPLTLGVAPHPAAHQAKPKPPPAVADLESADSLAFPPARWSGFPMLPDRRFPIVGSGAPPATQTTVFRYLEFAQAGLNLSLAMVEDPGTKEAGLKRIRVAAGQNIWSFVNDRRLLVADRAYRPGWRAEVDSAAAEYAGEQGVLGYLIADEPAPANYASIAAIARQLARRDPSHPALVILKGFPGPRILAGGLPYSVYLRRYLERANPALFAVRSYPLQEPADFPYFATCWESVATVSRKTGVPFWAVLTCSPSKNLRLATASELAWQANLPIAYGARGIVWGSYWTPSPLSPDHFHDGPMTFDGRRTQTYGKLVDVNARVQLLGQEIGNMEWQGVRHVGGTPYGCRALRASRLLRVESKVPVVIGFFRQMTGTPYALLVNRDYQKVATVQMFAPDTLLRWTRAPGLYRGLPAHPDSLAGLIRNEIMISPGDAELVRLPREFDYVATQQ